MKNHKFWAVTLLWQMSDMSEHHGKALTHSACVCVCVYKKVKLKCTLVQSLRFSAGRAAHRGSRGIALLFLDRGTCRGEGSASRRGRSLPPGKTRYPLYRRLGGLPGWSGQVRKISSPPGFDPRTVQLVASRYTDWAISAHRLCVYLTEIVQLYRRQAITDYVNPFRTPK